VDASDYHDAMAELDEYMTGSPVEALIEPMGPPPSEPTPIVNTVQAVAANGHLRPTMHWGMDIAERFSRAMDVPTVFARSLWGHYGSVLWGAYFDDPDHLEETNAKMAADEMLQAVMDEGGHNVQPGAISAVMRRMT